MLTFVGQVKAKKQLEILLEEVKPPLIILTAPKRYGKKTLLTTVTNNLGFNIISTAGNMDAIRDAITSSYTLAEKSIYLIEDAEDLNSYCQNALLKVTEEPPKNAYFVLTVKNVDLLLPTLLSRSKLISFNPYNNSELSIFTGNLEVINATNSPGQINLLEGLFNEHKELAIKIIQNIKRISAVNTFNILNHIKEEEYEPFFIVFRFFYMEEVIENDLNLLPHLARLFNKFDSLFQIKSLNKKNLFELMFLEIREATTYGVL